MAEKRELIQVHPSIYSIQDFLATNEHGQRGETRVGQKANDELVVSLGGVLLELLKLLLVNEEELPGLVGGGHLVPGVGAVAVEDDLVMVQKATAVVGASDEGGSHDDNDGEGGGLVPAAKKGLEGSHGLFVV